jgi:hypothetical protein
MDAKKEKLNIFQGMSVQPGRKHTSSAPQVTFRAPYIYYIYVCFYADFLFLTTVEGAPDVPCREVEFSKPPHL